MQRLLYLIQKEFRQIIREPMFIGIIFVMPVIQLVLIGFAVTTDVKNVPVVIVDQDISPFSRRLQEAFASTSNFRYLGNVEDVKKAQRLIDYGKAQLAVVIPPHFERDVKSGRSPDILAMIDGVDGNSAGVIAAYVSRLSQQLQKEWFLQSRQNIRLHLIDLETRMVYNPDLESTTNIVPGVLAMLIMVITSFLSGMSIVREREIGTLEQLMVTPIQRGELLAGKIIPLIVIVMLLFNVGIFAAWLIFGLWITGHIVTLELLALLFALSGLSLGIFISTIAQTKQQAMFFAWFFMIFSIMLSGFFIPIENMPPFIQGITYLNPMRYFMVVIREIYLKGTPFVYLIKYALALFGFTLVLFVLGVLRFRKRLS